MYQGLTPAQAYKQKISAKNGDKPNMAGATQYEKMLSKLAQFKKYLSGLKATSAKEKAKKDEVLPELDAYVDGVLESDAMNQNDVLVNAMIWNFDAGNIEACLEIAERVINAEMTMPEGWNRDAIDWLAEVIAERTNNKFDPEKDKELDNAPFEAFAIIDGKDITDQPLAKLHRAMGHVLHFKEPEKALTHYHKAHELWNRVGTSKLAKALEKQIAEKSDKK